MLLFCAMVVLNSFRLSAGFGVCRVQGDAPPVPSTGLAESPGDSQVWVSDNRGP